MPEVIFCDRCLEPPVRTAQAAGMWPRLRSLIDPTNLAAYLAWAAIGLEIGTSTPDPTGVLPAAWTWPALVAMHVVVLALFLACRLRPWREAPQRALVWGQVLIALAMIAVARDTSVPVLLIVAMAQNASLYRPRALALLFMAVNAAMYAIFGQVWQLPAPVPFMAIHSSFQLFAMITARLAANSERARDALAATNADLLATRSLLAESTRSFERLRLSRELHDVAGHKLTALKLNLAALARDRRFDGVAQVRLCATLADELLTDIRRLVQQMRLHDGMDLGQAIELLASPFPRLRAHVQLGVGAHAIAFDQAEVLLRAVQEALTNAARHGSADNIWIVLRDDGGRFALDIRDDGRGAGAVVFGNGLAGMRERLQALGGSLQVERNDAGGVQLLAVLPVAA
jgi:signal transduction histidine kinase